MLSERLLNRIESEMANRQGRMKCEIEVTSLPLSHSHIIMYFDRHRNCIVVNQELLPTLDEMEAVIALIHEGRHAYQWEEIMHRNHKIESQLLLDIWRYDFENYSEPERSDSLNYLGQGIEIDAIAYTTIEVKKMFGQDLIIPKSIQEDVLKRKRQILKQKPYKKTE